MKRVARLVTAMAPLVAPSATRASLLALTGASMGAVANADGVGLRRELKKLPAAETTLDKVLAALIARHSAIEVSATRMIKTNFMVKYDKLIL